MNTYKVVMTFKDISAVLDFIKINLKSIEGESLINSLSHLSSFLKDWINFYRPEVSYKENEIKLENLFRLAKKEIENLQQNLNNMQELLISLNDLRYYPKESQKEDLSSVDS